MRGKPEIALCARADLGEGPWWDAERGELLWVDIFAGEVHAFNPAGGNDRSFAVGQPVGMVARRRSGGLVCAVRDGVGFLHERDGSFELAADIEISTTANRMNDGACDPAGRLWAGTMASDLTPDAGALYRISPDLTVNTLRSDVSVSNGLDWSPDGKTFYFIDSATRRIDAYDFDISTGGITNRRVIVEMSDPLATPDGMAVDGEGTLWVAMWDGAMVRRYSPDGILLDTIDLPVSRVTSVAFGGAGLDQLFITSARHGLSGQQLAKEPLAGSIFVLDAGVRGIEPYRFQG